ncbi:MAG: N-acetylglucosamine-6-phosphate deacetylase [Clostridiales bacterium]|nr:N-acetylglucosamine-6-phosphate deacetylase [Clostridiales bacterium]
MKAIVNGRIVLPDRLVTRQALLFDKQIVGLADEAELGGAERIDAGGMYVLPGLIDMHIHGYLGEDSSDGGQDGVRKMARGLVENGVTSWLPTTMTVPMPQIEQVLGMMRRLMKESRRPDAWRGAEILGVNAEGPFLNPAKKGAQAADNIVPADAAFIERFQDVVRVFTVAPEMPGAPEAIEAVRRNTDVLISMGHTAATYDQAMAGISRGVGHVTHLFNAMTPLNHRDPGVVGAALLTDVSVELIADTFHIHPALFQMVARLKGKKLILVTDCTRAGGLPEGEYELGGQPIFVSGIECRLADGTIAGSVLRLNRAVANVLRHTDLPIWDVVNMASLNPASVLGVEARKGSLMAGRDADIALADDRMEIWKTFVAGQAAFEKEPA